MRNRRMKRASWLVVTLLLVFCFAAAKEKYEEKFDKTVALARDGKVDIGNISGDITVMTWSQDQVKIEALKANNISGDITAEAIGGAAALKAVSGDIQLTKAAGGADCNSVSGNVTVADVTGGAFPQSVSGAA